MNAEVFSINALTQAFMNSKKNYEREHVTPYIYQNPTLFSIKEHHYKKDITKYRLTVDEADDFKLIEIIIKHFNKINPNYTLQDLIEYLDQNPNLILINQHINQVKLI
jgi:spore coat polysaccharide biosynthesis protein SpsF